MTNQDFNQKFINVAKIGNPSVVSIISETITSNSDELFFRNDPFFRDFFPEYEYENKGMALGSGVIINKEKVNTSKSNQATKPRNKKVNTTKS